MTNAMVDAFEGFSRRNNLDETAAKLTKEAFNLAIKTKCKVGEEFSGRVLDLMQGYESVLSPHELVGCLETVKSMYLMASTQ